MSEMSHAHDDRRHHHHHHGHQHHRHRPVAFNKAFAISVTLHILFTTAEAFYAFMANSMSLLADAGHNLGDVVGLLMAWGASWLMSRPTTERYSYGYKRTTILAALSNALILVFTSALIAYEAIDKLLHPESINEHVVIWVALIGTLVNSGTALLFRKGQKGDLNIKGAYLHLMADAAISLGVVMTAIAILYTDWLWLDPLVGLLIVVAILAGTWELLRDSVNLFLDAVPHHINHRGVVDFLKNLPGVHAVHDLHIWGLSTQEVALTAHLIMPDRHLTDEEYQMINEKLKAEFHIDHVTLQVEISQSDNPCGQVLRC